MKVVFAGTPEFAASSLQALLSDSGHQVVAVYTQPDRPAGRGQHIAVSPVKQLAVKYGLPVFQPVNLHDALEHLADFRPDIMVVAAYGLILPAAVLKIPRLGCINIHASLLPRWRGASPIQHAILAGDTLTGITIMQMDEGLDTGDMLHQISCSILPEDTSQTLQKRLADLGASALMDVLSDLEKGNIHLQKQNALEACYAKKIKKNAAELNWKDSAIALSRQVRAFNPWPVAYTHINDTLLRIWEAAPLEHVAAAAPGSILPSGKKDIDVSTGDGVLRLLKIQLPGGRCLTAEAMLHARARLFAPGQQLGSVGISA